MQIKILHKGLADTVQDNGRYGFQHIGIPPNGYMDNLSALLANHILKNEFNTPVLELHFPSSKIQFLEDAVICITGANFVPVLNEKSIALHTPVLVQKNQVLSMLQPLQGSMAYIGFKGKFNSSQWLHSHAFADAQINTNDILEFTEEAEISKEKIKELIDQSNQNKIDEIHDHIFNNTAPIRILPGPAWKDLSENAINDLMNSNFKITTQRNRMGYHLSGKKLQLTKPNSYLSSAVTRGTLQLLPNGEIIVLMADHQTIGGYANLGQIILVDLPRFAQMKTGQTFTFRLTHLETAHKLYQKMYAQFKH